MKTLNRRLFNFGALSFCAGTLVPGTAAWAMAAAVAIPSQPMRLSRKIERQLYDGKWIVVTRDWAISFSAIGRGFEVNGRQVHVSVEAPENLNALAEIERNRSTNDRFPILLDTNGRIVGGGSPDETAYLDSAVREAERIIAASAQSMQAKGQALNNLAEIQAAGGGILDHLPADLFFPAGGTKRASRAMALPDGSSGEFELIYDAQKSATGPWLLQSERHIATRVGETERHSREFWQMKPA